MYICLFLFHIIFLKFSHVIACINNSFLFMAEYFLTQIYHILFLLIEIWFVSNFCLITNKATINKSLYDQRLPFLLGRYLIKSEVARSYGRYMFNFLIKCQTVFQSSFTILHSNKQGVGAPVWFSICRYTKLNIISCFQYIFFGKVTIQMFCNFCGGRVMFCFLIIQL